MHSDRRQNKSAGFYDDQKKEHYRSADSDHAQSADEFPFCDNGI